jgi:probable rRNA maturation factor
MNSPNLTLSVQFASSEHKALLPRHRLQKWIKSALVTDLGGIPAQFTLRFVGTEEGQTLNRDYRGKDYATNVLTFAYAESEDDPVAADLILCCPVVEKEALEQNKVLEAHYAHLIVHGVLHAQGFEHEEDAEAEEMENLEREILAKLGFDDPYKNDA